MDDRGAKAHTASVADALLSQSPTAVEDWLVLQETGRSIVLRGSGVVAKHPYEGSSATFAHEVAALRFLNRRRPGLAPRLIAVDLEAQVLLLEDLGAGKSLADALLGSDANDARQAIDEYIDALAALHMATLGTDDGTAPSLVWMETLVERALAELSGEPPSGVPRLGGEAYQEAALLLERLSSNRARNVFSFGDMCPDNNLRTSEGMRFFDLEGAGFVNASADLAYIAMPFPTCWCSFDLPEGVRRSALDRYTSRVGDSKAVDDLPLALLLFAFLATALSSAYSEPAELVAEHEGVELPAARQWLLHRIERALEHPDIDAAAPALSSWLRQAHEALTARWPDVAPMPIAPAFRELDARS